MYSGVARSSYDIKSTEFCLNCKKIVLLQLVIYVISLLSAVSEPVRVIH